MRPGSLLIDNARVQRRGHKRFIVAMDASAEYVATDPGGIRAYVEAALRQPTELRGPRGGRYVGTGEIEVLQDEFDPVRGVIHYTARTWAKYVRPKP